MLTAMLRKTVEAAPERIAIVQGDRRVSYGELYGMSARIAAGLQQRGIGAGDVVAVQLANSPEFAAAFFACARIGAVAMPLNPAHTADEQSRLLAAAPPKMMAGNLECAELLRSEPQPDPDTQIPGPALLLHTSGSTGAFKQVCCTQENLFYEAYNFCETLRLTAEDTILCTIPLHHSYGFGNCLLDAAYTGATLVLLDTAGDAPYAAH